MRRTYEQVADKVGLTEPVRWKFLVYMANRWPDTEAQKSEDGYAAEWAHRFLNGVEYGASDQEGQAILDRINKGA